MIITLSGENSFRLQRELDKLVSGFVVEQGDLALERIDGEEAEFARIGEALTSLPFLASKKMVVLRRPSANKQFVDEAEELLTDLLETTEVIIVEPKLDKRLSYYKFLKKATNFREYKQLDVIGMARWLADEAKSRGGFLSVHDAQYLAERVGLDQQLLANELDKLLLYDSKVTRESIELLTEATPQSTIFELLEAAFGGNAKRAMALYQEQRAMKVEPPQIIAMLTWQLHVLALIKAAGNRSIDEITAEAKISPFVVRKSQVIARKLTLQQLKHMITGLTNIDIRSKRTNLDIDEALQNYLLKIAI
jgi:DNA polymerase III delta subunit